MQHLTKTFETKLTADPGERAVVARISSTAVDRDGDVILPAGMDMADYKKNPVVLLVHDQGRLPIGTAPTIQRAANEIIAKVIFATRPETHPKELEWMPDTILSLFSQGVLRAFSIGLGVDDARAAEQKDIGRFGDGVRRIITKWRLFELSVCAVPANQEALAMAISKSWLGPRWSKAGLSLVLPSLAIAYEPLELNLRALELEAA